MEGFKLYDKPSFPLVFSYPQSAKYVETTRNKYTSQVCLRERKEKYEPMTPEEIQEHRKVGGGTLKSVFPKLTLTLFKAYVPASQSSTKVSYFMSLEKYLDSLVHWDLRKRFFPKATSDYVHLDFGEGEMLTYVHESVDYYRSDVYIKDREDSERFWHITYKHTPEHHSFEELGVIMDSIRKRE